jgi:hypothetical protein
MLGVLSRNLVRDQTQILCYNLRNIHAEKSWFLFIYFLKCYYVVKVSKIWGSDLYFTSYKKLNRKLLTSFRATSPDKLTDRCTNRQSWDVWAKCTVLWFNSCSVHKKRISHPIYSCCWISCVLTDLPVNGNVLTFRFLMPLCSAYNCWVRTVLKLAQRMTVWQKPRNHWNTMKVSLVRLRMDTKWKMDVAECLHLILFLRIGCNKFIIKFWIVGVNV